MSNAEIKLTALLYILKNGGNETAEEINSKFTNHKILAPLINSGLIEVIKGKDNRYYQLTRKGTNLIDGFARTVELFES